VNNPFDLLQEEAYRTWRTRKLRAYPAQPEDLRVSIERLERPSRSERAALRARIDTYNMALVQTDPAQIETEAMLAFARALGLRRTDANLFADASAVSRIAATRREPGDGEPADRGAACAAAIGDFIPYTDKPLSWHTDGYYNGADAQIGAWCLFCVRPAREGGENGLLDHEMAYLQLRDDAPQHIAALSHPHALAIPAHVKDGRTLRAESVGPVLAVREGRLHMRYSARARNVVWRDTPDTNAARAALDRLFSQPGVFTFSYRLRPGDGIVSNNVLHCRSGFEDDADPTRGRLLYRLRFLDRIAID
jgi:alpha-ketoglutarate-dependent taurine dioxygenase